MDLIPSKNLATTPPLLSGDNTQEKMEAFISAILEEIFELIGSSIRYNSPEIKDITATIMSHSDLDSLTEHKVLDALSDLIMHSSIAIHHQGYSPRIVVNETIKEIETREGRIIEGKFIKDKSKEAKAKWYLADFSLAKYTK